MTSQMLMKKIQKKSVAKYGVHFEASSAPTVWRLTFVSISS